MPDHKPSQKYNLPRAEGLINMAKVSMGKTELRQALLPLVSELQTDSKIVEITDRDKPVAVLLSYDHYMALNELAKKAVSNNSEHRVSLLGSVEIFGDLEAASKEIAAEWDEAIERSAAEL